MGKRGGKGQSKGEDRPCKWCEQGECWDHGQIEKPEGHEKKKKHNNQQGGKGGGKAARGGKGGGGGGKGGGGAGQWMFIPAGAGMPRIQQHHLKQAQVAAPNPGGGESAKNKLSDALRLLLDRNVTKDDCVYEMEELPNGKHVATLQVAALTRERTDFKGKPAADVKTAQQNAAQSCLNICSKEIKAARAIWEEQKEEKMKAKAAANKERQAAKKAEKEAAGEA